jgi:plastocyanin
MAAIDKAAVAWTIAIVAIGVGIAGMGDNLQSATPNVSVPTAPAAIQPEPTLEPETKQVDPFADIAAKVKEKQAASETKMMEEPKKETPAPAAKAGPQTVVVTVPAGTSVPGCEETNECYLPPSVSIKKGDTVSWNNVDTAAHTVTSGTPANGPDGTFDSSLLMGGNTFEVTFDKSGSYDYFCMVHPWMIGKVQVS